jgi:hypothetical protein
MGGHSPAADDRVVVTVVRTGGIAGLRREWAVEASGPDATPWMTLIDRCPWDDDPPAASGADRYMWRVSARTPARECRTDIPDSGLRGPWRDLVHAAQRGQDDRHA